jgi:hypothetical protein
VKRSGLPVPTCTTVLAVLYCTGIYDRCRIDISATGALRSVSVSIFDFDVFYIPLSIPIRPIRRPVRPLPSPTGSLHPKKPASVIAEDDAPRRSCTVLYTVGPVLSAAAGSRHYSNKINDFNYVTTPVESVFCVRRPHQLGRLRPRGWMADVWFLQQIRTHIMVLHCTAINARCR